MTQRERPTNLRLFIAVELPAALCQGLAGIGADLGHLCPGNSLRWVKPESIHLTLRFLGAVDANRLGALVAALRPATGAPSFEVLPGGTGTFGGRGGPRVIWVGLGDAAGRLAGLACRIDGALEPVGFARETRPFRGHLTLARVRDGTAAAERRRIAEQVAAYAPPALPVLAVNEVSLMQSFLGPGGARHECVERFGLRRL